MCPGPGGYAACGQLPALGWHGDANGIILARTDRARRYRHRIAAIAGVGHAEMRNDSWRGLKPWIWGSGRSAAEYLMRIFVCCGYFAPSPGTVDLLQPSRSCKSGSLR